VTAPPGGGGGTTTPPLTKAVLTLRAPASQRFAKQRAVIVTVATDVAATVRVAGTLSIPGASKVFKLAGVTRALAAGTSAQVRLKLSTKRVRAITRALRRHRKVVARLTITAVNAAGTTVATRTVRAKR
jgi:hypothetical protein